ncbi:hypothetical protein COP2_047602 [Malus domestica]
MRFFEVTKNFKVMGIQVEIPRLNTKLGPKHHGLKSPLVLDLESRLVRHGPKISSLEPAFKKLRSGEVQGDEVVGAVGTQDSMTHPNSIISGHQSRSVPAITQIDDETMICMKS